MLTLFKIDFRLKCEDLRATPAVRLPDVGERFAFVGPDGRRHAGTVVDRSDEGEVESAELLGDGDSDGASKLNVVALTIEATSER